VLKIEDYIVCIDVISHTNSDKLTVKHLSLNKKYSIKIFFDRNTGCEYSYYQDYLIVNEINHSYIYASNRFITDKEYRKRKLLEIDKC